MKTVSIKFGTYDLNEEETHVFYEGENCEVFTDQEGKLYIHPPGESTIYLDDESQPKDEDGQPEEHTAYSSKHGEIIGYKVQEECTLSYKNYEYDEKIYIDEHEEDQDWPGIVWYDNYPQIFKPIFPPQK